MKDTDGVRQIREKVREKRDDCEQLLLDSSEQKAVWLYRGNIDAFNEILALLDTLPLSEDRERLKELEQRYTTAFERTKNPAEDNHNKDVELDRLRPVVKAAQAHVAFTDEIEREEPGTVKRGPRYQALTDAVRTYEHTGTDDSGSGHIPERFCFYCTAGTEACNAARIKCCPDCTHDYAGDAVIVPCGEWSKTIGALTRAGLRATETVEGEADETPYVVLRKGDVVRLAGPDNGERFTVANDEDDKGGVIIEGDDPGLRQNAHKYERVEDSGSEDADKNRCEFPGKNHDEPFCCGVCERLVCGRCATSDGNTWLCPEDSGSEE